MELSLEIPIKMHMNRINHDFSTLNDLQVYAGMHQDENTSGRDVQNMGNKIVSSFVHLSYLA